ncbi:MAG: FtsQ-type POTRA domain-containing protein [Candidatus Dadabacteria bacterium]|nr:FtsQ-type POTRA domain-containing protein [Candidatus Dadabacteria bacterium]
MKNKFFLSLFVLIIICWIILNPLFAIVKKITIVGNKDIAEDEIVQTSELLGNFVFFYNKNSFKKKLKENIMIKNIHLSLLSYTEVKIEIIERNFIFKINNSNTKGLIDSDGFFFYFSDLADFPNLPFLEAKEDKDISIATKLLEMIAKEDLNIYFEISEIIIDKIIGTQIYTTNNQIILLGKDNFDIKLRQLKIILNNSLKINRTPRFIDLREKSKGIVNYNL